MADEKTPLGSVINGALELLGPPGADTPEQPEEDTSDEIAFAFPFDGQAQTFQQLAQLAGNHPHLIQFMAAEILHLQRNPSASLSQTERQREKRLGALRALDNDPLRLKERNELAVKAVNLINMVLACTAQMTHLPPPPIQVVGSFPEAKG